MLMALHTREYIDSLCMSRKERRGIARIEDYLDLRTKKRNKKRNKLLQGPVTELATQDQTKNSKN